MSEVKGTLLAINLAVSVFSIVFGIITVAMYRNASAVSSRMNDSVLVEPDVDDSVLQGDAGFIYTFGN